MPSVPEQFIPVNPEKVELLGDFYAAEATLRDQAPRIQAVVDVLSALSSEPTDEVLLPAAAAVITAEGSTPATALDVMPLIQKAAEPYEPRQVDLSRPVTERASKDWEAVKRTLEARIRETPELGAMLVRWFLDVGHSMVETTFPAAQPRNPLQFVAGGANDQCAFRNGLALATLASPEFRRARGLITRPGSTLNGEDGREAGWLSDQDFTAELREHVAKRIRSGEVRPRLLVSGSGERVLSGKELSNAQKKYIGEEVEPLYSDRGWTEADAMLAGAQQVFGRQPGAEVVVEEFPAADTGAQPTKLITFESLVGPVTFIATTGSEATILHQLRKANRLRPELFGDIDALHLMTTATYTWEHQRTAYEAAAGFGLDRHDVDIQAFGLSTHAAGAQRELGVLVGELTNYLKAIYNTARRSIDAAERNARYDLQRIGGVVVETATGNS